MQVKSRIQVVARSLALASMAIGCVVLGGAAGYALGATAAVSASASDDVTDASQRWEDMNKALHLGRYQDADIVLEDIGFFE